MNAEITEAVETLLVEAYQRGWREGIETLIEDYPDAEAPHKDAMGEGCGAFMSETYAKIEALSANTVAPDAWWMIERDDMERRPMYLWWEIPPGSGSKAWPDGFFNWTPDWQRGARFATKEEAEKQIGNASGLFAREHSMMQAAPPASSVVMDDDVEWLRHDLVRLVRTDGDYRERLERIAERLASSKPADGWQPIETAPRAMHMLATYFDEDGGEWMVSVVMHPFAGPWTHWRPLPEPPAALSLPQAKGDA